MNRPDALQLALLLACLSPGFAAAQGVIQPGSVWLDTSRKPIEAHGGGILEHGKTYYWYGEDRTPGLDPAKRFVSCYESKDLAQWRSRGDALKLADPEQLGDHWVLERPKVFYSRRSGQYVMYFHLDDAHYRFARVGVAESASPCGPFHYKRNFRPLDQESRDIGGYVDDDGTGYLLFESRPTGGFFIAKLTPDDLGVQEQTAFLHQPLEGNALAHFGSWYYVVGSHMTGWKPNPDVYASAKDLRGPWSDFNNIAPPETNTFGSQSAFLLTVQGTQNTAVIYMGDIWKPQDLPDSRYLWMPLTIGDGEMHLPAPAAWSIDVKTGVVTAR